MIKSGKMIELTLSCLSIIVLAPCFILKTGEGTEHSFGKDLVCYTKLSGPFFCVINYEISEMGCPVDQSPLCFRMKYVLPSYGLAALIFGIITIILISVEDNVPKNYETCIKCMTMCFSILTFIMVGMLFFGNFYIRFTDMNLTAYFIILSAISQMLSLACAILTLQRYLVFRGKVNTDNQLALIV